MKQRLFFISLWLLVLLTILTRFYNLNWGAPYYFNPDERNIATSIIGLSFPSQMNPHFFAYGSLPIYAAYFLGVLGNIFTHTKPVTTLSFGQGIFISRFFSALFSSLIPFLLYRIGKNLLDDRTGFVAAFLGMCSVGLTQYAHFGTFEIWLTIETLILFLSCVDVIRHTTVRSTLLLGLVSGALIATKISSLPLLIIGVISILLGAKRLHTNWHLPKNHVLKQIILLSILFVVTTIIIYILTNPYMLLDMKSFLSSISYEKNVATGMQHVFYTDEFLETIPGLYQLLHVFPFLLTPLLSILWIPALIYSLFVVQKERRNYLLFVSMFLLTLIPQCLLYVKWTRYMVPTLPFMYIFFGVAFTGIFKRNYRPLTIHLWSFLMGILSLSLVLGWSTFIITVYRQPDTRITAANWAKKNLDHAVSVTSEPYDLGLVPFNAIFPNIHIVDLYTVEEVPFSQTLSQIQDSSNVVLLPSTRISRTRMLNSTLFPHGALFYSQLLSGKLNYSQAYQTPCDMFCSIAYFGRPEGWYEETSFVFDHPTITILTKNDY